MATRKQKPTVETQKIKIKESNNILQKKSSNYKGREHKKKKQITKEVIPYLSIITLNIKWLNSAIKSHRLAEWIKQNKTQLYAPHKRAYCHQTKSSNYKGREYNHISIRDKHRLKEKR